MWFFTTLYHSLFDIEWLRSMRSNSKAAWGYASIFIGIIAIIHILPMVLFLLPRGLHDVESALQSEVPEFTAEVKNGVLSVNNLPQPFIREEVSDDITLRLVIDTVTTTPLTVQSFIKEKDRDMVILVTRSAVSLYDGSDGTTDVEPISGSPDSVFTKADLVAMFAKIKQLGVPFIQVMVTVGFTLLSYVLKLMYLLILTLIMYVIVRFRKLSWSYRELLTVGLFALTLPTLIQSIGRWLAMPLNPLYTLVFLFLMYTVVTGEKQNAQPATPPTPPAE